MSATDKEHTDTEKTTEQTESDQSNHSVGNAQNADLALTTADANVAEETVGVDRGTSAGNSYSSDSTPPTTIENAHMSQSYYFQTMFRTFAGDMEVFRESSSNLNTQSSLQAEAQAPTAHTRNPYLFEQAPTTLRMSLSKPEGCTCSAGEVGNSNRHSCYSHTDQHVRDDLIMRSASFDTSAASISSVTTIPDSVVYDLSCGSADEAVDIMSSDDHPSLYSPTGMSFDGVSDYYSSDPECSAGALARMPGATRAGADRHVIAPQNSQLQNVVPSRGDAVLFDQQAPFAASPHNRRQFELGRTPRSEIRGSCETPQDLLLRSTAQNQNQLPPPVESRALKGSANLGATSSSNDNRPSRNVPPLLYPKPQHLDTAASNPTFNYPSSTVAASLLHSRHLPFPANEENNQSSGVLPEDLMDRTFPPDTMAQSLVSKVNVSRYYERGDVSSEPKTLFARLTQSLPVWYLPNLSRKEATDYLRNRQPGNFIVRHSSQPGTMALSLRSSTSDSAEDLVEHFQIINTESGLQINEAQHSFVDIVSLLQHYHQVIDGLPCLLRLPRSIERANGYELNQFWMMGQKFWLQNMDEELADSSGGSNSDEFASDPTDRATLERTNRTISNNDDNDSTAREGSPHQLESRPPAVPPKTPEIKQLIQQDAQCSKPVFSGASSETSAVNVFSPGHKNLSFGLNPIPGRNHNWIPNVEHQITVSTCSSNLLNRRPPDLNEAFGTDFSIHSPTGSVFHNSKTTPSDSGYDTSSRNVFELKLQSNHPHQMRHQDQLRPNNTGSPLSGVRSDPMIQPTDMFSSSCPASAFSRSDSNATEHNSGLNLAGPFTAQGQYNPSATNPFTFPISDSFPVSAASGVDPAANGTLISNSISSSSRLLISPTYRDSVPAISNKMYQQHPTNSHRTSAICPVTTGNCCNNAAFSDDASVSSDASFLKFSSNNPFKHCWHAAPNSVSSSSHKCNSAENFQNGNNVVPVTASSCESVRSAANQSERSSTSSIFISPKVINSLYHVGRSKMCEAPTGGMSPNSYGNWMSPEAENSEYNTTSVTRIKSRSSTLPRQQGRRVIDNDNSLEEHEDNIAPSSVLLLDNPMTSFDRTSKNRRIIPASLKYPAKFWLNLRRKGGKNSSVKIRDCILQLAQNPNTIFHHKVQALVQKYSVEQDHTVLLNQVRREMNALGIYLKSPNEKELSDLIDKERGKLRENEFLNMDAITEDALYRTVLKMLYKNIMEALEKHHRSNGNLEKMEANMQIARAKSFRQLGIPKRLEPPQGKHLDTVKYYFTRVQCTYSPTAKMEHLLAASKAIYNSVESSGTLKSPSSGGGSSMGAEEFLPMLIYCLANHQFVQVELEASYIWAFMPAHMLRGDPGYYLTALSSAAHILKNMPADATWTPASPILGNCPDAMSCPSDPSFGSKRAGPSSSLSPETRLHNRIQPSSRLGVALNLHAQQQQSGSGAAQQLPCISDIQGFLKIVVPDEKMESIISKTLPVPPGHSAAEVCSLLAHKLKISHNPEEYGLYVVVDGQEAKIHDEECPQQVKAKLIAENKRYLFAYRRQTAHIIWPNATGNSPPSTLNSTHSTCAHPNPGTNNKNSPGEDVTRTLSEDETSLLKQNFGSNSVHLPPPTNSHRTHATPFHRLQQNSKNHVKRLHPGVTGRGRGGGGSLSPQPRQAIDNPYVTSLTSSATASGSENMSLSLSLSLPRGTLRSPLSSPEPMTSASGLAASSTFAPVLSSGRVRTDNKMELPITSKS